MKQIFLVNFHSFVDVITNSSTELFISNTEKSIETVKEILRKMLDICNMQNDKVDDIFRVYVVNKSNVDSLAQTLESYERNTLKKSLIGKIIIEGVEDNNIPYELFDLIESKFSAERLHLG